MKMVFLSLFIHFYLLWSRPLPKPIYVIILHVHNLPFVRHHRLIFLHSLLLTPYAGLTSLFLSLPLSLSYSFILPSLCHYINFLHWLFIITILFHSQSFFLSPSLFLPPLRDYTQVVMNYLEGKKAGTGKDLKWAEYFDVIIVGGNKPAFLEDERYVVMGVCTLC